MGVSLNGDTQQPWVFLLKMIILRCFEGTTIFGCSMGPMRIYVKNISQRGAWPKPLSTSDEIQKPTSGVVLHFVKRVCLHAWKTLFDRCCTALNLP